MVLVVFILFLSACTVWAEVTPNVSDRQEQNNRVRIEAQERQQREKNKDVFLQNKAKGEKKDHSLPIESPSFVIKQIRIEGIPVGNFSWAQKYVKRYVGQKTGIQGVNRIVKRLKNEFIDRGYITTQISVPNQNIGSGELKLVVQLGKIGHIRFTDSKIKANWQTAFPTRPGNVLNLRNLEQGLEQMQRLPSRDVNLNLVPGEKVGETDVVISLKEKKPWRITQSLDDSGISATGKLKTYTTLVLDNLFNLNDAISVAFNNDAERRGSIKGVQEGNFSINIPYGKTTITLSSIESDYHQMIAGMFSSFKYSGDTRTREMRINQIIDRTQNSKTYFEFALSKEAKKSYLEDFEIEMQRQKSTLYKFCLRHRLKENKANTDFSVAYQWGHTSYGVEDNQSNLDYKFWTFDVDRNALITLGKRRAIYNANLHVQYAGRDIPSLRYLSIGDRYTVRGFDGEQTLSARNGWFLQNEMSFLLPRPGLEFYIGLDCGQAFDENVHHDWISGSLIGLRGGSPKWQYNVFIGCPLKKPEQLETANFTAGFQLSYQY
jgi:hemolysin activation/secretion protein